MRNDVINMSRAEDKGKIWVPNRNWNSTALTSLNVIPNWSSKTLSWNRWKWQLLRDCFSLLLQEFFEEPMWSEVDLPSRKRFQLSLSCRLMMGSRIRFNIRWLYTLAMTHVRPLILRYSEDKKRRKNAVALPAKNLRVWTASFTLVHQWLDPGFSSDKSLQVQSPKKFFCHSNIPMWRQASAP